MFSAGGTGTDMPWEPPKPSLEFEEFDWATPRDKYVCEKFGIEPVSFPYGYALPIGSLIEVLEKIGLELDEIQRKLEKMNV